MSTSLASRARSRFRRPGAAAGRASQANSACQRRARAAASTVVTGTSCPAPRCRGTRRRFPRIRAGDDPARSDRRRAPPGPEHRDVSGGWLRPAVFGAMDGLVTNVSLIAGVGGGGGSQHAILLTGLAGLAAGAFSMAAGEFVSVSSQNELVQAEVDKEQHELTHNAVAEQVELVGMLRRRGISAATARLAAAEISAHPDKALAVHALRGTRGQPGRAAVAVRGRGRVARRVRGRRDHPAAALRCSAPTCSGLALGLAAIAAVVGGGLVARLTDRPFWRGALRQLAARRARGGHHVPDRPRRRRHGGGLTRAVGSLLVPPGKVPRGLSQAPLRIALLSYRSKPHSGGQGVYVRHLSRELAARGHHVEVFSGQPYPELDAGPAAARGAEPRPLPGRRPVPHPAAHGAAGLGGRARGGDDVGRRVPRAADVQRPGAAGAAGPARRLRHRARQPGARLRHARRAAARPAARHLDPPPDLGGQAARPGRAEPASSG